MAICGTGMASLAGLLKQKGFHVMGSDNNVYPPMSTELERQGIPIFSPYNADNLKNAKPDLVIVGNAISKTNVEAAYLLESSIPYISMPQALNQFFLRDSDVIVISGTHGKTTTTSLMAHLLTQMGLKPSFLIGGVSRDFGSNFSIGSGKYFVIEGDEYDTAFFDKGPKFLHYNPKHVIMTSLEFDHADIYRDLAHITESFVKLAGIIPASGSLHANDGYTPLKEVVKHALCRVRSYGSHNGDFRVVNFLPSASGSTFDLALNGKKILSLTSPLTGIYNAENVAACFSVLEHLKLDLTQAAKALTEFKGVKRRQEVLYDKNDVVLIDDFAHHPTAVSETILGIKNKYPHHHLVAVFEPRSNTSRRAVFQDAFAKSFSKADEVILANVNNPEKIIGDKILDVEKLVADITKTGREAHRAPDNAAIVKIITENKKRPLCVLVMSNGDFGGLNDHLITSFKCLSS